MCGQRTASPRSLNSLEKDNRNITQHGDVGEVIETQKLTEMLKAKTHVKNDCRDFEKERTGGSTLQSTGGLCINGIPSGGWKTDFHRREEWTAGLDTS